MRDVFRPRNFNARRSAVHFFVALIRGPNRGAVRQTGAADFLAVLTRP